MSFQEDYGVPKSNLSPHRNIGREHVVSAGGETVVAVLAVIVAVNPLADPAAEVCAHKSLVETARADDDAVAGLIRLLYGGGQGGCGEGHKENGDGLHGGGYKQDRDLLWIWVVK